MLSLLLRPGATFSGSAGAAFKLNNIFDLLNEQLNPILKISVPKKILSSFGKEIVDEMLFSNHNIIPDVLNKNLFKFKDENFKISIQGMIF